MPRPATFDFSLLLHIYLLLNSLPYPQCQQHTSLSKDVSLYVNAYLGTKLVSLLHQSLEVSLLLLGSFLSAVLSVDNQIMPQS